MAVIVDKRRHRVLIHLRPGLIATDTWVPSDLLQAEQTRSWPGRPLTILIHHQESAAILIAIGCHCRFVRDSSEPLLSLRLIQLTSCLVCSHWEYQTTVGCRLYLLKPFRSDEARFTRHAPRYSFSMNDFSGL